MSDTLDTLKVLLDEREGCRVLSDQQLAACIEMAHGDVMGAAYHGALIKAQEDGISLPGGVTMASSREYYLGLAQMYRPNRGGVIKRADDGGL